MNEIKEALKNTEQNYKLFRQQQFTFIRALRCTRENARDMLRPVASISQVQSYMDHHCNNSTDRCILNMFLNICNDLCNLCQKLETLQSGNDITDGILERCKLLLSHSNDLSTIRAKYPHDVVNRLSCDEAKNHYGGVVSLIPIVLDYVKEWVDHTEKLPRYMLCNESGGSALSEKRTPQGAPARAAVSQPPPPVPLGAQTSASNNKNVQAQGSKCVWKKYLNNTENHSGKLKGPWKPPGRHAF
ncbi:sperm acrosome-associated protein 9 [Falco rusticolus]|uniref:sperm acrosome-associated protein 9 n=1 Tax=Falco rusticolus TaxID=120794 RepID=UPI0006B7C95A|nr:sperm acrosome-associated protein 9 [Falco rusticolus]XP_037254843.1 sperm acrosome-associated protein 9 [Falco rusticolus]XP_055575809.1 sperm acrosome-associated protein 9 [Falco cherrug]XP_055575810.1 sperm acrosome-associated protein 9 [Falco cherrug]